MKFLKKVEFKIGKYLGHIALLTAKVNSNTSCFVTIYQAELPKAVKKLRKF